MIGIVERLIGHVASRGSRVLSRWAVLVALAITVVPHRAHADAVDELVKQLDSDSDKVRLAAAINLTKAKDARAIIVLAKHVNADVESDATVRSASASGLGQLVTAATKSSMKNLAVKALQRAEANDPSDMVKKQAAKALTAITGTSGGGSAASGAGTSAAGGVYVNIGPMSSKTGTNDPTNRALMVKVAGKHLTKVAPAMVQVWPTGKAPTKAELDKKRMMGFYVDGTLNSLTITKSGSSARVSCKISMLLASYPDKAVFGMLSGGAAVDGSASPKDIALASEDCIVAVVEDLIKSKIVPTIKSKAGP